MSRESGDHRFDEKDQSQGKREAGVMSIKIWIPMFLGSLCGPRPDLKEL